MTPSCYLCGKTIENNKGRWLKITRSATLHTEVLVCPKCYFKVEDE